MRRKVLSDYAVDMAVNTLAQHVGARGLDDVGLARAVRRLEHHRLVEFVNGVGAYTQWPYAMQGEGEAYSQG